jgi:hypothetical protein
VTEVQELAQTIAVNDDIDVVETEAWPDNINSLEGYLEGVFGDP